MIFNDAPYYNEPGHELQRQDHRSENYNRTIEDLTLRHAILYWLANRLAPPKQPLKRSSSETPQGPGMTTRATGKKVMVPTDTLGASTNLDLPALPPPVKTAGSQPALPPVIGQTSWSTSTVGSQQYNPGMMAATNTMPAQAGLPGPTELSGQFAPVVLPGQPGSNLNLTMPGQMPHAASQTMNAIPSSIANFGWGPPPPEPPPGQEDPIFSDVIRYHFQLNAKAILATAHRWEAMAIQLTQGPMAFEVPRLERLLQQHGFHA